MGWYGFSSSLVCLSLSYLKLFKIILWLYIAVTILQEVRYFKRYKEILHGTTSASVIWLQWVKTLPRVFLTGLNQRDHITPALAQLHWLPIHYLIQFKVLLFVYKAFRALLPPYLPQILRIYLSSRTLGPLTSRRTCEYLLVITRYETKVPSQMWPRTFGTNSLCQLDMPLCLPFSNCDWNCIFIPWLLF